MKKSFALLLSGILLLAFLAGCGATAKDAATRVPAENGAFAEGIYDSVTLDKDLYEGDYEASAGETPAITERKLIRNITLSTETEDLDTLLAAIDSKVAALGGYIENREVYTGSHYSSYRAARRATLTVRIPKDKLDIFVVHVSNESNVISSSESSDDVTLTYVSVQSRMVALQKEEARLLELIDKAANLTELLELEKRLTEVRTDLENVTSQLLLYDNLVDYGTISISIQEVQQLTPVEEPGFWSRISTGFMESLQNLWEFMKELTIFLVVILPYLIPTVLIVLAIVFLIRKAARKPSKNRSKKYPTNTQNPE